VADSPELSVVVPVHDEAENLAPLIGEIRHALAGRVAFEIVYVDDGSADDTPARLRALRRDVPELRVIRHRRSSGQSAAIHTGVRHARGRYIATLDGDGQNDPADIPRLLDALLAEPAAGPRMVVGQRTSRHDSAVRRFSSRIANGVRGALLRDRTPDTGCGLKLFSRELFLEFPFFDHMHRFLPALALRQGGEVVSVPVNHRPRERGRSHYGIGNRLWVGIVDLFGVLWLVRRMKRPEREEEPAS
jgi:dolichol-phosphate mannosyltransferase